MKVGTKLKKEKISKTINTDLAIMDNIIKKQLERGREKSKNGPTYIDNRNMTKDTKDKLYTLFDLIGINCFERTL